MKKGNRSFYGSGFQISSNYVGTAGHCVYLREKDGTAIGWADEFSVFLHGERLNPINRMEMPMPLIRSGWNWVADGTTNFDSGDDWGTIKLNKTMPIGYLGKRKWNDNSKLNGKTLCGIGYPNAGSPNEGYTYIRSIYRNTPGRS